VPVDFTSSEDIRLIVDTFLGFVQRKLPIRIGLVPITPSPQATEQAKVVYHLLDTYGLSSVFAYLEIISSATPLIAASKAGFESSIEGKKTRVDKVALSLEDVFKSEDYELKTHASQNWIRRLSADTQIPPMFVDGAAFPRDENYLQSMSTRITADLSAIQNAIFKESFADDTWLPDYFLAGAAKKRNTLVVPEDEKALKVFDLNKILGDSPETLHILPRVQPDPSSDKADWAHLIVITDLDSDAGEKLLTTASIFREANPSVELVIVHNPASSGSESGLSSHLFSHMQSTANKPFQGINDLVALLAADVSKDIKADKANSEAYWQAATTLLKSITLRPGESGFLLDGRLVGPIPDSPEFAQEDLDQLLAYERSKRITPALKAIVDLGLAERIKCPLSAAKVTSIVAISTISDIPPGIHEQAPLIRMGQFDIWNTSHTLIEVGDVTTASIQVTILLDPASELGQRWTPMLKILSQLDGIYMKIFLNPKERLSELPIKRFYRYVLGSKPTFDDAGALENFGASFTGVPQEALLTVGLDIPPAWLVGPEISVYDLDNIKLSSIKTNVEALYKLEYILIEGHSREMPSSAAPRGAQLVLGTERDPHFADTIIMANLGYFQFKANPGFYKISLQEGRSSEIFSIDSIGSHGWTPVAGDESTEVVLMSFQGATIYPRLSRNSGAEAEDVLEAKSDSPLDFVSRGLNFAQGMLGSKGKAVKQAEQAEINIFSVASGHLYERMLNIMMVSVMKHTKHTVKFWFIEQFLSPSFKDFIPFLAAEYGFKYEMVTYKWPHWLRGQKEKQREIWGYKILFLDVLFPLSLDKVIFVDADQIVRTDMIELVNHDLKGAPYGFTPMCDSRTEMEGFRFWKQGYWEKFLRGFPYHISALYVVDLQRFRQMAAGDRLRQQYHQLSADPNSLSNLDQDLPNHMQAHLPIHSLPQEWLWCETWCSNESLKEAKTIDLCNNPLTKEPKLDRARRQVPEWTMYDDEIAAVDKRRRGNGIGSESGNEEKNIKSRTLEVESTSKKDEL
jgi:UDP-glucose:glycoprotein glucosyltransferase